MGTKSFRRSRSDRKLAGIVGGLAEYIGMDSSILRLIVLILMIVLNVPLLLVYIICAFVVPEE